MLEKLTAAVVMGGDVVVLIDAVNVTSNGGPRRGRDRRIERRNAGQGRRRHPAPMPVPVTRRVIAVVHRNRLGTCRLEDGRRRWRCPDRWRVRVVGGEAGAAVGAGEMDRAGVSGDRVVVGILALTVTLKAIITGRRLGRGRPRSDPCPAGLTVIGALETVDSIWVAGINLLVARGLEDEVEVVLAVIGRGECVDRGGNLVTGSELPRVDGPLVADRHVPRGIPCGDGERTRGAGSHGRRVAGKAEDDGRAGDDEGERAAGRGAGGVLDRQLNVVVVPAVVGVPLMVMVSSPSVAWSPEGNPVAVRLPYRPVPPKTLTVLLKPGWLAVQAVFEGHPNVGAGLTAMEYVPVLVAPVASCTVSWTLL